MDGHVGSLACGLVHGVTAHPIDNVILLRRSTKAAGSVHGVACNRNRRCADGNNRKNFQLVRCVRPADHVANLNAHCSNNAGREVHNPTRRTHVNQAAFRVSDRSARGLLQEHVVLGRSRYGVHAVSSAAAKVQAPKVEIQRRGAVPVALDSARRISVSSLARDFDLGARKLHG